LYFLILKRRYFFGKIKQTGNPVNLFVYRIITLNNLRRGIASAHGYMIKFALTDGMQIQERYRQETR